jgi:hypothetical protein
LGLGVGTKQRRLAAGSKRRELATGAERRGFACLAGRALPEAASAAEAASGLANAF